MCDTRVILLIFSGLQVTYFDGVVGSSCDQQRLSVQKGCRGNSCAVGMSMLCDNLTAFQIPESNVTLRTARCHNRRTI